MINHEDKWWICNNCRNQLDCDVYTLGHLGWKDGKCERCGQQFKEHPNYCDKME